MFPTLFQGEKKKCNSSRLNSRICRGLTKNLQRSRSQTALKGAVLRNFKIIEKSQSIASGIPKRKSIKSRQETSAKSAKTFSKHLQNITLQSKELCSQKLVSDLKSRKRYRKDEDVACGSQPADQGSKCKKVKPSEKDTDSTRENISDLLTDSHAGKMDDDYYHYRRHDHHVTETNPDYTGRFQHINSAQYRDRYRSFDRDRLRERYDHLLPGERFIHDGRVYRYGQSQHEAYSEDHDRYSPVERVQPRRSYHHNDMSERERRMPVTERSRWGHGYELDSRSDGRFVKDHSNLMFDYAHNSKTFDGNYQISNNDQFFTYDPSVTDWSEFRTTSNWQDVQTSHQRKGVAAQDKNNVQSGKPLASARSLVRVKGSASRLMAASSDQNLAAKRISKPGKKNTATPSKAVLQSKCTVAGEVTSSSAQEPTSANSESLPIIERSARQTGIKEQISPQTKVKNKTIQKQRSPIKGNLTKTIANRQQIVAQTKDLAVAHGIQFTPKTVNRGAQSSLNLSSRSTSETSRNVKIPDKPSNIVTSKILPENIHQEKNCK